MAPQAMKDELTMLLQDFRTLDACSIAHDACFSSLAESNWATSAGR